MKISVMPYILLLVICSCAPIPHTTGISPKISGYILDAESNAPIENAKIYYERGKYQAVAITDSDGMFCVGPLEQWHYLLYIGSPGHAPFPDGLNYWNKPARVSVSASGYVETNCWLQIRNNYDWFDGDIRSGIDDGYDFKSGDEISIGLTKDDVGVEVSTYTRMRNQIKKLTSAEHKRWKSYYSEVNDHCLEPDYVKLDLEIIKEIDPDCLEGKWDDFFDGYCSGFACFKVTKSKINGYAHKLGNSNEIPYVIGWISGQSEACRLLISNQSSKLVLQPEI